MCKLWMFTSRLWTPYLFCDKISANEYGGFIMTKNYYCKKCGRIICFLQNVDGSFSTYDKCDYCKSHLYPVPKKYYPSDMSFMERDMEQLLREELVKTSPEFDKRLFEHRIIGSQQEWDKQLSALEHGKAVLEGRDKGNKFGVECPYCHATNVKKITNTSKAVHTALFGVFSVSRNSKNFHCNNCNSDF